MKQRKTRGPIIFLWLPNPFKLSGEAKLLDIILKVIREEKDIAYLILTQEAYCTKLLQEHGYDNVFPSVCQALSTNKVKVLDMNGFWRSFRVMQKLIKAVSKYESGVVYVRGCGSILTPLLPVPKPRSLLKDNRPKLIISTGLFGSEVLDPRIHNFIYKKVSEPNLVRVSKIYESKSYMLKRFILSIINSFMLWKSRDIEIHTYLKAVSDFFSTLSKNSRLLNLVIDDQFFYFKRKVRWNDPTLLAVGRFSRGKNFEMFIIIVDKLRRIFPDLKATIVGSVDDREYYQHVSKMINDKNLKGVVQLSPKGDRYSIREAYWSHNILLNLSSGALGIVNAEASLCGTVPVVHKELIDAITPWGVVYSNYRECFRKIVRLLNNPEEIKERSIKGAEFARKFFSYGRFKSLLTNSIL